MILDDDVYFAGVSEMLEACRDLDLEADWYIFGSAARGDEMPADIDVLCVVDSYEVGRAIKRAVDVFLLGNPIDLRILSRVDEAELDFIRTTKSSRIEKRHR